LLPIHSGPLVYVELFGQFTTTSPFSGLSRVSTALSPTGQRLTAVVPITDFALACHIAPQFGPLELNEVALSAEIDLHDVARRFFFNHFYNYYIYMLAEHWRKHRARG
jgi:hypothetical protein